ncbi:MAG: glyoxylate/hydroxypyruvate reductase A [Alphaproteobacteria bacterium]|nr:glyoxylate/hydroxypyruvate reductase A [Alphaproteobacteria bacterium]TAD89597.1 MAG: glyoxylate/hydroxypyruvate reductase A [Alphaproteobacteria bacterium]
MAQAVLFHSGKVPPAGWLAAIARLAPEIEVRTLDTLGDPAEIDVAISWRLPSGTFKHLTGLKLMQCSGAGVDQLLADPELPPDLPLARMVDPLQADEMVAFALWAVVEQHRDLARYRAAIQQQEWLFQPQTSMRSRRVGVLGLGAMGGKLAARLAALGFATAGWARTARTIPGVTVHHGAEGLAALLADSHILVNLLPLTRETRGLLNLSLFRQLPKGARVINLGRGPHLVEEDLLTALAEGHLASALLDVFTTEPLPEGHPFWSHPQITITPHIASLADPNHAAEQVVENIRRVRAGLPALNLVDRQLGY